MSKIDDFSDPFFDIAALKPPGNLFEQLSNQKVIDIYKLHPFPEPKYGNINQANENFKKNKSYTDAIRLIKYNFPFSPQIVKLLSSEDLSDPGSKLFTKYYLLFTYNTWIVLYEKLQETTYLWLLLEGYCKLVDKNSTKLVVDAFIQLIAIYINTSNSDTINVVIPIVKSLFTNGIKLPDQTYRLIPMLLRKLITPEMKVPSENVIEILGFFEQLLEKNNHKEINIAATMTINAVRQFFLELDVKILTFFHRFSQCYDSDSFYSFVLLASKAIVDYVKKGAVFFKLPETEENLELKYEKEVVQISYGFNECEYFKDFSINGGNEMFDTKSYDIELVTMDLATKIEFITESIYENDELIVLFMNELIRLIALTKEKLATELAAFVYITDHILKRRNKPVDSLGSYLVNPIIFESSTICTPETMKSKEYQLIGTLRNMIINNLLRDTESIGLLLDNVQRSPLLFSETLYRLMDRPKETLEVLCKSTTIPKLIAECIIQQKAMFKLDPKNVTIARSSLFRFLSFFFSDFSAQKNFFSDSYFPSVFISCAFNDSLSEYVIGEVKNFLASSDNFDSCQLPVTLNQVISILCFSFPDERSINLTIKFTSLLSDVLMINSHQAKYFTNINVALLTGLPKLSNDDSSRKFFIQCIMYFVITQDAYTLKQDDLHYFESGINNCFSTESSDDIFKKLVQYLSGDLLIDEKSMFLIRQPLVLNLMFNIYSGQGKTEFICDYITKLCNHSIKNCAICRRSEFDIFVVDRIWELWTKPETSESEIKHLFGLFFSIAKVTSSAAVVQRFISLLCPYENHLQKYYHLATETLLELFKDANKVPANTVTLVSNHQVEHKPVMIKKEIDIALWVYIGESSDDYYPALFRASDTAGHEFITYIYGCNVVISNGPHDIENLLFTGKPLKENSWNFVGVRYTVDSVTFFINDNPEHTLKMPEQFQVRGQTKFIFGNVCEGSSRPRNSFYLGPYAAFPQLKKSTFNMFASEGHTKLRVCGVQAFFNSKPTKNNNNNSNSFFHVMVNQCRADIIIPMFKFLDTTFVDGTKYEPMLDSALHILTGILLWSEDAEKAFNESQGVSMLSKLLLEVNTTHITYNLYFSMYTLLLSMTYQPLKKQIVSEILLNFDLWIVMDPIEQMKVYSHWCQHLLPNFEDIFISVMTFSSLLTYTILYFKDSTIDPVSVSNKEKKRFLKPGNEQAPEIRSILYRIAISISKHHFTFDDFNLTLSYCISSTNEKLVMELISMLGNMSLIKENSPFRNLPKDANLLSPILSLLQKSDDIVVIAIIEFIVDLYSTNVITNVPINITVNLVLRRLQPKIAKQHFIDALMDLVRNKCAAMMPILCWSLSLMEHPIDYLSKLTPSQRYTEDQIWPIWPMVMLPVLSHQEIMAMFAFIIECDPKQILKMFSSIEVMSKVFGLCSHSLKRVFIVQLTNMAIDNQIEQSPEFFSGYCSIVKSFFFSRKAGMNKALKGAFRQSPFADSMEYNEHTAHTKRTFETAELLMEALANSKEDRNRDFGLTTKQSFDLGNNLLSQKLEIWPDADLLLKTMSVLEKGTEQCFLLETFICYYLASLYQEEVKNHFNLIVEIPEAKKMVMYFSEPIYTKFHMNDSPNEQTYDNLHRFAYSIPSVVTQSYNGFVECVVNFCAQSEKMSIEVIREMSDQLYFMWHQVQDKLSKVSTSREAMTTKRWRYLWSSLTIDNGPWQNAADDQKHLKRDQALCFNFCPFKLKRNWNFQGHEMASYGRDKGNTREDPREKVGKITEEARSTGTTKKKVMAESICRYVNVRSERKADIALYHSEIVIMVPGKNPIEIKYKNITLLMPRTFLHLPIAFEIFTECGMSYFIVLSSSESARSFMKIIDSNMTMGNRMRSHWISSGEMTQEWVDGKISTFEYLIDINMRASRSFNSPSQYPIFPWIISDYTSEQLDLSSPETFRDLGKPVGALTPERLENLKSIYNDLKKLEPPGHLYSNGPMCPLILYLHMLRIEPFTTMHINIQSGRFDTGERIFNSIPNLYKSVCHESNDFRELNAEFFFSPEFLQNLDEFDLGLEGDGDVILPPWAKDPLDFIYLNRKALESDYVSAHIHSWIDLLFGYKQSGPEAEAADNIYMPDLLESIWTPENMKNKVKRSQIEASKTYLGQLPQQIFKAPHPQRSIKPLVDSQQHFATGSQPVFVVAEELSKTMILHFIDQKGKVTTATIKDNRIDKSERNIVGFSDSWYSDGVEAFGSSSALLRGGENKATRAVDVRRGTTTSLPRSMQCAGGSKKYLVAIGTDNVMYLYESDNLEDPIRRAPLYRESVRCCAISDEFHLMVIASRDGSLVVHSLESESNVFCIDLGKCVPRFVVVTQCWGFIVSISNSVENGRIRNVVTVHTVNGSKVKEAEIGFDVAHVCTFRSSRGFDYIALANNRGFVYVCEAYYLEFSVLQLPNISRIVYLGYNTDMRSIIIATDTGEVISKMYDPDA